MKTWLSIDVEATSTQIILALLVVVFDPVQSTERGSVNNTLFQVHYMNIIFTRIILKLSTLGLLVFICILIFDSHV